jgi:hypothetical protein
VPPTRDDEEIYNLFGTKYYEDHQTKEDEMGACSTHEEMKNVYNILVG